MADKDKRYDVVIYCVADMIVDTIAGEDMSLDGGFRTAEKRLETLMGRINDSFAGAIVPTGKYRKGDKLKARDIHEGGD